MTIAAGNTTAEFTVSMTGDETDELDETFNVTISMPEPEPDLNGGGSGEPVAAISGGDTAAAAGTILDDDPAVVTVAPKVDTVEEGEPAVFVLTRAGMTNGRLAMQVRLRSPGRLRTLDARFEPGAVTTEIAVATHNNNLVDYPSVRDYTIEVFGDGAPLGQDDRSFTPGTPASATVKVTDDDKLINVTVSPVKALLTGGDPYFEFRRDGDTSQPLTIEYAYFLHTPGANTDFTYWATATFEAGQDEVVIWHDFGFEEGVEYSPADAENLPSSLTYVVFGDGRLHGLNRIYQGGDPNTATVTMEYNGYERRLVVGAEAPLWVSVGQTVSIPLTVTNTGTLVTRTPITITATHKSDDRAVDGANEPRMTCQFDGPIAAGESAGCEVSFLVLEKDLNPTNHAEIELDVVASDGRTTSNAFRIFMRVRNGVSVGFNEAANLPVTEPGFGEANARANLTVTRVGRSDEEVQVAYTLEPWPTGFRSYSPVEGVDYADNSATPGVITFGENETEKTITIDILGDQIDEAKEQFLVTLVPPEGVLVEEHKRTRIVVINDTNPPPGESYRPTASLQLVSSGPVPESEGPVEFAIVLDREWGIDGRYEVEVLLDQLTATPGIARLGKKGDFEDPGVLVVRIPAGQTRFEFSIPLYDDDVREEDETFQLLLGSSIDASFRTIGTSNKVLATIADDDDDRVPPTGIELSLSHRGSALASVLEGSNRREITVTASFAQVRWPGDASNAPLHPADPRDVDTTVRVQVDPNSGATHAAGPDDFEPLRMADDLGEFQVVESFDIVIPAGQTSGNATVRFWPVKDDVDEEDETVTLQGSEVVADGSENSLPVRSASFTIIDDDTRGITIDPDRVLLVLPLVEGGEPGTYSLVLDSQPTDTVTITLAGNQGGFLMLVPDTLTFTTSDWATPQTVSVMAMDDGIAGGVPPTNFITHQVSGGDYGSVTVRDIQALVTDTTQAFVYLEGGQASESDGHVEFTVTVRPILRTTPVLVRYATVDGTAIAGSDYTREVATGQTYKILNIPAGQSSATIRIPIIDDQVYESADETFTLQLTNHNNKATLDGGATSLTATGAIADDDPKPVVSVAGPAGEVSYVSENAKDPVTFTLTLVGQSAGDVTVDYATGEAGLMDLFTARQGLAGATEDEDYAGTSGTVTFTSGQTTKTVTVQVTDDDVSEDTEFFGFRISSPQGADLRGQRSEDVADVGLLDDDARGVAIGPTSIGLDEPVAGGTAVAGAYTMNLNSRPTDTVTVTIGGSDPAVSLSGDTLTNNQLTFTTTNWNTAQTITVTPVKDDNAAGETITLTHTVSGGDYAGIAADSVTVSLTDSDTRNLVLSEESLAVTEGDATGVGYTVKLATRPSDTVTVTISGHDGADLTLSGTTLTNNQLTFTTTNWGTAQTVTVKPGDDDNTDDESETLAHTASGGDYVNVTKDLPVSITDDGDPPTAANGTVTTVEDTAHTFAADEFGYADADGDALAHVKIIELTAAGTGALTLNGTAITSADLPKTVTATELTGGGLKYAPPANANGTGYASFKFKVNDGTADSASEYFMTINVSPVNDPATGTPTISGTAQVGQILTASTGDIADPDGVPSAFTYQWKRYAADRITFEANIGTDSMTYTLTAAEEGKKVLVEVSFTDNGGSSEGPLVSALYPSTQSQTVDPNNPPTASDGTVTTVEDTDHTFAAANFSYSDTDSDPLASVKIIELPAAGTGALTLNGTAITSVVLPQTVTATELTGGGLKYAPPANANGTGYASFKFKVNDGTADSASEYFMTINVTAVNDPATGTPTISGTAQVGQMLTASTGDIADPDGVPSAFTYQWKRYAADRITFEANIGTDSMTYTLTASEEGKKVLVEASFTDNGGSSEGPLVSALYPSTQSQTVDPNNPPTASDGTVTTVEDTDHTFAAANFSYSDTDSDPMASVKIIELPAAGTGALTLNGTAIPSADLPKTVTAAEVTGGKLKYAPPANANGTGYASFKFKVNDGAEDSASEYFMTINVTAVNDPATGAPTISGTAHVGLTLTASTAGIDDVDGLPSAFTYQWKRVDADGTSNPTDIGADSSTYTLTAAEEGKKVLVEVSFTDNGGSSEGPLASAAYPSSGTVVNLTVSFGETTYMVTENGTISVIVHLSADPERTVAIPITATPQDSASSADYSVPTSVTFNAGDMSKTITFTATQDAEDDDGESVLLAFGILPDGVSPGTRNETTVSITDDDDPQVTVSFGQAAYTVAEGGTQSVTVTLSADPERTVVVPITATPQGATTTDDYTVPTSVTFDAGDMSKTIAFTATQDEVDDDGESVLLGFGTLPPAVSLGTTTQATVSITDDDVPPVTVQFGDTTYEVVEGETVTVAVTLSADPERTVVIPITHTPQSGADSPADYSGMPESLTFNTGQMSQTITFTAAQDEVDDDGESVLLGFGMTLPPAVSLGTTTQATVSITDDDAAGVTIEPAALSVVAGRSNEYTAALATEPTGDVTVTVSGHAGTDVTLDKTTLTFAVDNWDTAQTVTVSATQNAATAKVTLAHTVAGADYGSVTAEPVVVSVVGVAGQQQTIQVGVSSSTQTLTVPEGGANSYTLVLGSRPTDDVTVGVTLPTGTDLTLNKTTLTFTSTNWDTAQTVTVTAAEDDDGVTDAGVTLTHTVSGGGYGSTTVPDVEVSITENDSAGIVLSETDRIVTEGDAAGSSYTVKLATEPLGSVSVTISGHDGADLTLSGTTLTNNQLTFTTTNWATAQTVTIKAGQDDDGAADTATLTHTASGGDYAGITAELPVTVTDDDSAGIVLSETDLTVTEGYSAGSSYTVKLATEPSGSVIVTISGHDGADLTLSGTTLTNNQLTFTTTNWDTAQTVTVKAGDDDNADNESETLAHTAFGGDYVNVTKDLPVSITDDEVPVTVQFGATTYEVVEGETVTVAVTLSADPERTVVIPITHTPRSGAESPADYSVPQSVTFDAGEMSKTITFTAAQDDVDDDGESVLLAFGAPLPGGVSLGTTTTTTVNITDDDGAGVSVSDSSLTIAEGSSGTYTIVLDSQPTADVTVTINDPSNTDVTAEPAGLTFSSTDWNTPKTVTVDAAQDDDADDETATVTHTVTSTDSKYSGASANSVTVTITDDEVPVTVSFGQANYTVAEGDPVSVTVTLSADPERMVVIPLTHTPQGSTTSADYSGVPANVTFSTGDMSQTITFTATQDDVDDGGKSVLLAFGTTLPGGVSLGTTTTTTVNITDDDGAGVTVSNNSLDITEGSSGTYTIVLDSQPTADVTVTINDPSNTDVIAEPASLTFSSTDWNSPKTVTVNAAQDADAEDETATVTHAVTSTDSSYSGASANNVAVSVTDDEVPVTVQFGATTYEVVEGETITVAVTLSADPERTVVIPITHTPRSGAESPADYSGVPTSVTFNTGQMSKTIAFTAAQDDVDDDGESVLLAFGAPLPGGVSLGTTVTTTVSITDDDGAGVSVSESSLTITEGSSGTYTIVLDSQPTADVTVTINDPSNTDVIAEPASLTFSSTDWNSPKTVTVNAAQDADAEDETATVTHAVTSTDSSYSGASANNVAVSVTDDEVPVTVQFGATTYEVVEGETITVAVTLSADPERTVVIPITHTPRSGAESPADYSGVPTSVTFNTGQMSKTIAFTAAQDDVDDDGESVLLTFGAPLPGGVSLGTTTTTTVNITDDDGAGVTVSNNSLDITEGSSGTYTIVLDSQPTADVTVTINDPSNTDVIAEPASLTFSSTDWNTPKTVTVNAAQDADAEDETATVTHAVTSTDSSYSGAPANSVAVSVTDDEVPVTVQFGATTYEVVEGETVTVAVTLSADPERTVAIPITHTPRSGAESPADYSVPQSVTFDAGEMSKTITFTAAQDDVDDDGESVLLAFGAPLPGGVSLGTTVTTTVSITDDDDPQVAVSFDRASYRVLEGDTVTVGVTLSGDPKRTVEIPLTATDYGGASSEDYSGVPSSVTINAGETSKTFEFMAMADDASDTGESVMIGFGTSLPSRVTEGTPNEARVNINQMSTQFSLDCSLTATVWCADLGFSDRVAENYGWLYMRYGHGWDPPSSLSDDDFRFRGVDYDVRSMELLAGTHPVMPNAWSTWQQGYSSFRIGIYWDHRWGAPSEEHYRDWVLHLDGLELPFKDALRHGSDFVWVGAEFQQVFNDWTPSTVTKIGIKEVAAADQDTNPLLPWAPMQVDAWPEGPDRLLIVWAKPASFYPGLPDPTSYTVQWKLASADWSDSAAVSQLEVAATSNFQAVIMNGMTEDAVYSVRVIASNDAGDGPPSEETLGRPQDSLPRLIARTVNGQTLTLRFSEQLDPNAVPAATNFVVKADGGLIMVDSVAISGDEVILTLHHAVTAATHSVLVRYDKPTDPSAVFLQDTNGNYANIRQHHELLEVVNITPQSSVQPLTALFTNMPSSHDGRTRFTFDIEFSEPVWIGDGLARDDMLEITGGTVISAPWKDRRTDKFIVHVRPDTQGDIVIVLPGHRACHGIAGSYQEVPDPVAGAPCAIGSRVLTNEPTVTIPGPSSPAQQVVENTPAEGEPQINGIPEVGQTLSADTTAISDADGLENAVFQYQWLAEDADISGATGATYTVVSGDVGQAIRVRVTFTDDAGHEEALTSAPTVVTAGLQLQSATVDGAILTLTYNEELDTGVTLGTTAFAVNVNGSSRLLIAVGVGESHVLLLLSSAVEAGDTATVDYTAPDGPDFVRDIQGRKAASFSGQAVTNDTASAPLTASAHDAPSSHNGQDAFTFELRFSEDPKPDFSYTTVRDHAFTVTGGAVTYVRRLEPGKNVRWEITVTPGSSAAVAIALNATTDCSAQGAICTEEGGKLSGGLQLAVPGPNAPATPNTPATDAPTISGTARVGETLTADTTGISDGDGLDNATFAYQWLADAAEINGATASTYTLVAADAGKAIKVRVSFTDDAGNDEQLTSAVTGAVAAAPPPPNTSATGLPTITGAAQVGETLTADTTGISDDDGLDSATFSYQWLAADAEINGATASSYTLVAADAGKAIKVRVSFTDDAGNDEQLTSAVTGAVAAAPPPPNTPATGAPTITGDAQVGEALTASATGISDDDGLGNAIFSYQWLAADAEINNATASSYTLVAADAGKAIKVRVSFTDDAGNEEQLTSAVTAAVVKLPLTASVHDVPSSHNGQDAFTFELRFSGDPKPDFSYTTVRDHAFTVTGGSVTYVRRLEPGKNVRWEITVTPSSSADMTIALNATTDCSAQDAICTEDGRMLSNRLELTINGTDQ